MIHLREDDAHFHSTAAAAWLHTERRARLHELMVFATWGVGKTNLSSLLATVAVGERARLEMEAPKKSSSSLGRDLGPVVDPALGHAAFLTCLREGELSASILRRDMFETLIAGLLRHEARLCESGSSRAQFDILAGEVVLELKHFDQRIHREADRIEVEGALGSRLALHERTSWLPWDGCSPVAKWMRSEREANARELASLVWLETGSSKAPSLLVWCGDQLRLQGSLSAEWLRMIERYDAPLVRAICEHTALKLASARITLDSLIVRDQLASLRVAVQSTGLDPEPLDVALRAFDERASTTIVREDAERALGTRMAFHEAESWLVGIPSRTESKTHALRTSALTSARPRDDQIARYIARGELRALIEGAAKLDDTLTTEIREMIDIAVDCESQVSLAARKFAGAKESLIWLEPPNGRAQHLSLGELGEFDSDTSLEQRNELVSLFVRTKRELSAVHFMGCESDRPALRESNLSIWRIDALIGREGAVGDIAIRDADGYSFRLRVRLARHD